MMPCQIPIPLNCMYDFDIIFDRIKIFYYLHKKTESCIKANNLIKSISKRRITECIVHKSAVTGVWQIGYNIAIGP